MNERISDICKVEFATIGEISSISDSKVTPAVVSAVWQTLDCAAGSVLNISQANTKEGRRYQSSFNCTMRSKLLSHHLYIVRITLNDGSTLLIGDQDIPVRFIEDHALKSKSLIFTHTSWHYPYPVISAGSGSASGGI